MTRKHFQDLADTILPMWDEMPHTYVRQFVLTLIPFLKRQNPRFDKHRFLDACGYSGQEHTIRVPADTADEWDTWDEQDWKAFQHAHPYL